MRSAAPCFGLTPAQVRMKSRYNVPEIWVADRSRIRVAATAQTLRLAGHKLAVIRGSQLLLPPQRVVQSFCFGEHGLVIRMCEGPDVEVPYHTPTTGVVCSPRCATQPPRGEEPGQGLARTIERLLSAAGGSPGREPNQDEENDAVADTVRRGPAMLDLYIPTSTGLMRGSFVEGESEFAGVCSIPSGDTGSEVTALARECGKRFSNFKLDERLVEMLPRRPVTREPAVSYSVRRRGYSYGSNRLPGLLREISPDLAGLSQAELSSRLAYLTCQQSDPDWRLAA